MLMYTEMVKSKSIQDTSTCSNVDLEFNQSIAKVEEIKKNKENYFFVKDLSEFPAAPI